MGKYINILFQAVTSEVLDSAKNERPKTDLNLAVFSYFSLAAQSQFSSTDSRAERKLMILKWREFSKYL